MANPADFVSPNPDISPPPNPTPIQPVPFLDGVRKPQPPPSQVSNTPIMTTPHPTLSQGSPTAMPSNGGKQQ